MSRTPPVSWRVMMAASVALVTALTHTAAWATPIIYFTDGSSGGSGGGRGSSLAGGGGGFGGSSGGLGTGHRNTTGTSAEKIGKTTSVSGQAELGASTVANSGGRSGSAGGGVAPATTTSPSSGNASNVSNTTTSASNAADPLKDFFQDLAVDLGDVDNVGGGPAAGTLTHAFDAADVISSVDAPGDAPFAFGAPESGVVLTNESFPPDTAVQAAVSGIENPEPATLILLGSGLLYVARRHRILKRRGHDAH